MEYNKDLFSTIVKLKVLFVLSFILVINPASSIGNLKCNVMEDSIFTFKCTNARRIWVNFMDYHTQEGGICSRGGCNKTLYGEADGENILCHGQYGQCTQRLNNTILDDICGNVTALAVEINYDCTDAVDGPMEKVQCPLPNDQILIPDLSCPDNSTIHIHSVGYWKISEDQSCLDSKEQCYKYKTGVEDLMYKKCRGEEDCRPNLPQSIDDGLGCIYQMPYIGADVKYSCLNTESMYDVCDSMEVEVANNTVVYLISREYINKPGVYEEPFCKCNAMSTGMEVKLLYYDMPKDSQGKTSQLIFYDNSETLNLRSVELVDAEPFTEPKENLTVEFIHNNISSQIFLIEFKALNGSLKLKCGNPTPVIVPDSTTESTDGLISQSPVVIVTVVSSTENPNEGGLIQNPGSKLDDGDIIIIGVVLGIVVLLAIIILIIALVIRKRRQYKADEEGSVYSGVDNPAFLHQTYTVLESDTKSQSSDFVSDPQNQTSIPIHQDEHDGLSEIKEIDSEHIENNGLNLIHPNDDYKSSVSESIPEASESLDNYDQNYQQIDHFQEPVPSLSATPASVPSLSVPSVLAAPPTDHVEYAKVNKRKKPKVQNESLFDNSFSNIKPPEIPDKTYTEEEISDYRKEKLKPYINITNTQVNEDQKDYQQNNNSEGVLNESHDVIQPIPVQPDVIIFQPNSDSSKPDDDESVLSGNDLSTVPEEDENLDMTSSFPDVSVSESPPRKPPRQSSYTEVPFLY